MSVSLQPFLAAATIALFFNLFDGFFVRTLRRRRKHYYLQLFRITLRLQFELHLTVDFLDCELALGDLLRGFSFLEDHALLP